MLNIIILWASLLTTQAKDLPHFNIDPNTITISGVSSGGFMAVQMQVAHSKLFAGAASVAGGPYWCSKGSVNKAQSRCMSFANINIEDQINEAQRLEKKGLIDPLSGLSRQSIYIYASPTDYIISLRNSDNLMNFYKAFRNIEDIQYEKNNRTGHGFPTLNYGSSCLLGGSPWLLDCGFDLAGAILRKMYGPLNKSKVAIEDHLEEFSQAEFVTTNNAMYEKGWLYAPEACRQGIKCHLHIALHGCKMNPDFIEDQFVRHAGYNEWAENNKIVVLYPQGAKVTKANPKGCWDWFGFTSSDYANQKGLQIKALYQMIKKISQ